MRYQQNKGVREVLDYLRSIGVATARQNFHTFLRRVLYLLPQSEAIRLQVDVALLRAVRVRLKMPADPSGGRLVVGRATRRHDSRRRRRKLQTMPKSKRLLPPGPVRSANRERATNPLQSPLSGTTPLPATVPDQPPLQGNEADPKTLTRKDWQVINRRARTKLRVQDRMMHPNYQGTVIHICTRREYTAEELVELYNLTPTEAQSCFQTFTT